MSPSRMEELQSCTRDDKILQSTIVFTLTGWPKYEQDVPDNLKQYFNVRDLLSVSNGLLTYADRIVVSTKMRPEIFSRIHQVHQGIVKCIETVIVSVWLPGITHDVKRIVEMCDHCQAHKPKQHREPLMTTPLLTGPMQRIAADFSEAKGQNYLIVVDYYSRWIEILHVNRLTSAAYIKNLKDIFARYGIPAKVVPDNGPHFASAGFQSFAKEYGFKSISRRSANS